MSSRPRLLVHRSNKTIYAQIVDDQKGITLFSASSRLIKKSAAKKTTKVQQAEEVGRLIAQKATTAKIKEVVFDRRTYRYHGRVKALAEAARQEGLKF